MQKEQSYFQRRSTKHQSSIKTAVKGGFLLGATLLIALGLSAFFLRSKTNHSSSQFFDLQSLIPQETQEQSAAPQPTPFPFQELTIPYLKNRTYASQIGTLQQARETQNYTGYLTNYDSDGLQINGYLTIPKGDPPQNGFPAIVFVHGYIPPASYRTLENYNAYVDYFADRGIAVFKIDLRGHDKSEGEASGAYYSSDYVIDVLNAYAALQKFDSVDAQRIGLWGHSMAGNVLLRALAVQQTIPKTVIWAGAVYTYEDFGEFGIADNSYRPPETTSERRRRRDELFALYGSFDTNSWFWQQIPATNYLDGVQGQIQVHHAVNDTVVPIEYSRDLMKVLDGTQIPHELFEYANGGHNITGGAFSQAMQRSVEFFLN